MTTPTPTPAFPTTFPPPLLACDPAIYLILQALLDEAHDNKRDKAILLSRVDALEHDVTTAEQTIESLRGAVASLSESRSRSLVRGRKATQSFDELYARMDAAEIITKSTCVLTFVEDGEEKALLVEESDKARLKISDVRGKAPFLTKLKLLYVSQKLRLPSLPYAGARSMVGNALAILGAALVVRTKDDTTFALLKLLATLVASQNSGTDLLAQKLVGTTGKDRVAPQSFKVPKLGASDVQWTRARDERFAFNAFRFLALLFLSEIIEGIFFSAPTGQA